MFKKAAQTLAVALLFAASVAPVIHGFSTPSTANSQRSRHRGCVGFGT